MSLLWVVLAACIGVVGLKYRSRSREITGREGAPKIDDAAIRSILQTGRISADADHEPEPLDLREAARAEEEFWAEYWDEPEEYRS